MMIKTIRLVLFLVSVFSLFMITVVEAKDDPCDFFGGLVVEMSDAKMSFYDRRVLILYANDALAEGTARDFLEMHSREVALCMKSR